MMLPSFRHFILVIGIILLTAVASFSLFYHVKEAAADNHIIYVDATAGGSNDGSSWGDAFTDLQAALASANPGDEIWVAAGLYKPTGDPTDREATFQLQNGVAIYGGFAGDETARDERDWQTHLTVLSGDIDDNDLTDPTGVVTDTYNIVGDNSYHVVTGSGVTESARLDGFIITAGLANNPDPPDGFEHIGAGMINDNGRATLFNLIFSGNIAEVGGAMVNFNGSHLTLTNVTFNRNSAIYGGGGILNDNSSPTLIDVTFTQNWADHYGGALHNQADSNPVLTNVDFIDNVAAIGGGLNNENSNPTLTNIFFAGNYATDSGGGIYNWSGHDGPNSSPTLTNVLFLYNNAYNDGGAMFNIYGSSPTLTDVTFSENSARNGGAIYNHGHSNPSLTNVLFDGNEADNGGGLYNSGNSNPSLTEVIISNNSAAIRGGGMYNFNSSSMLTHTTFSNNSANFGGGMWTGGSSGPILTNVTFANNNSLSGGGMSNGGSSSPILTNVTFSNNSATSGGGMYNSTSNSLSLTNVTFSNNSAGSGGGMRNAGSSPTIENSLFWHNSGGAIFNEGGANPTISYSLVQGCNPDGVWNSACGTGAGNNNLPDANPLLAPLADNGGPTLTHMPRIDSPAIAAGNCSSGPATDQRGEPRPQDTTCDIGSVEVQPDEDRRQHCGLTAYQTYAFAATAVHIEIETVGNLSCLDVGITNAAHPTATANIPAPYVTITTTPALATGYIVTMTLLHPDYDNPLLCKYPGNMGGAGWDCARDGFDNNLVWRGNITGFSDWAVGHDVNPTAVSLRAITTTGHLFIVPLILLLLLFMGSAAVLLRELID